MNSPIWTQYTFIFLMASSLCLLLSEAQQVTLVEEVDLSTTQTDGSQDAIISERETVDVVEDSSVAEAVERRPDLNFNNVTIDGEKATVDLDEIQAEGVSSLEVLRAVTPDLDADSRGGSLSLESNPTYNLEKPVIKGTVKIQLRESGNKLNKDLGFSYGEAFGNFGFNLSTNYSDHERYGEFFSNNWEQVEQSGQEYFARRDIYFRNWDTSHREYSLNLKTDYKVSDILSIFFRSNYEHQDHQEDDPSMVYRFGDGEYSNLTDFSGTSNSARIDRDLLGYNSGETEYYLQTGAVAKWDHTKLDFQISYDDSSYLEPNWFVIEFEQNDVDLHYEASDPLFPTITTPASSNLDASLFTFDELLDEVWESDQSDLISTINLKHDFEWKRINAYIKTGVKFRTREKNQRSDSSFYTSYDGNFSLADVISTNIHNLQIHDGYVLSPVADVQKSRAYFKDNFDNFTYDIRRSREKSDPNTYQVEENISAAYVMLNLEKGRLRGIIGARMEQTELEYTANEVIIGQDGTYLETLVRTGSSQYDNLFPSLHLRYFLGQKTTIITSWTGTIQRPYYGNIVPYRNINYEDRFIGEGNPDLKPTLYDNLDLSIDYKLSNSSVVSLELFHNQIDDIVFWEEVNVVGGMFDGFDLGKNNNGPSGTQKGVKFIWDQKLSDWSEILDGFSFNMKVTFIESETEYPNRPGDRLPITGKNRSHYQCSLTYDKEKIYAQLTWQRNSDTLQGVDDNAWRDNYSVARDSLDINSSYQLTESLRFFFNLSNLLSEPYQNYRGSPSRPSQFNLNQRRFDMGIKMKW